MTLKMYHSYVQPKAEDVCKARLDRCSHLCVPRPRGPVPAALAARPALRQDDKSVCLCPTSAKLLEDGFTCSQGTGWVYM